MRAVVQRVRQAQVTCAPRHGEEVDPALQTRRIGQGLVVFVGVTHDDEPTRARKLADKLWTLRIFDDEQGVPNLGCAEIGGQVLVISQFTLYADARKGRRPSYRDAAEPARASALVDEVTARFVELGAVVRTGCFGEHMQVSLVNDGPWTLTIET